MATITVSTADLRRAAAWAKPTPNVMPVLANVRVSVVGGQLVLAVYDWEECRMARFPGPGDGGTNTVLVPHKMLTAAIGTLPRTGTVDVRIEHDGAQVDLLTKAKRVSVEQDCPFGEYPAMPAPPPPSGWCDTAALRAPLKMAARCTGTDATLPAVQAVHFALGPDTVRLEATNRRVLTVDQVPCNRAEGSAGADWLMPGESVAAFADGCAAGPVFLCAPPANQQDGLAMLADSWHTLVWKTASWREFPKITTVTGKKYPLRGEFTCDRGVLAKILTEAAQLLGQSVEDRLAVVLADKDDKRKDTEKKQQVRQAEGLGMFVEVTGSGVQIFAVDQFTQAELGRWEPGGAESEGAALVSLDPSLLGLLLPGLDGDVTVRLSDPKEPVRVTAAGAEDYLGVIMTINAEPPRRADDGEEVPV